MSVNSSIQITHIPSGLVVICSCHRSQHKNKEAALKLLKSKLYMLKLLGVNEPVDMTEVVAKYDFGDEESVDDPQWKRKEVPPMFL